MADYKRIWPQCTNHRHWFEKLPQIPSDSFASWGVSNRKILCPKRAPPLLSKAKWFFLIYLAKWSSEGEYFTKCCYFSRMNSNSELFEISNNWACHLVWFRIKSTLFLLKFWIIFHWCQIFWFAMNPQIFASYVWLLGKHFYYQTCFDFLMKADLELEGIRRVWT